MDHFSAQEKTADGTKAVRCPRRAMEGDIEFGKQFAAMRATTSDCPSDLDGVVVKNQSTAGFSSRWLNTQLTSIGTIVG